MTVKELIAELRAFEECMEITYYNNTLDNNFIVTDVSLAVGPDHSVYVELSSKEDGRPT